MSTCNGQPMTSTGTGSRDETRRKPLPFRPSEDRLNGAELLSGSATPNTKSTDAQDVPMEEKLDAVARYMSEHAQGTADIIQALRIQISELVVEGAVSDPALASIPIIQKLVAGHNQTIAAFRTVNARIDRLERSQAAFQQTLLHRLDALMHGQSPSSAERPPTPPATPTDGIVDAVPRGPPPPYAAPTSRAAPPPPLGGRPSTTSANALPSPAAFRDVANIIDSPPMQQCTRLPSDAAFIRLLPPLPPSPAPAVAASNVNGTSTSTCPSTTTRPPSPAHSNASSKSLPLPDPRMPATPRPTTPTTQSLGAARRVPGASRRAIPQSSAPPPVHPVPPIPATVPLVPLRAKTAPIP
ncbi:hypothetical protein C8F04DRAFT_1239546 [Mycena alexandri]|uniref:Uncharacterized protein n=1 Tax=Mycena alexandri TaxID=1745969 RepID=A0AAD6SEN2_9AGAR|nr:hypothetical protein C8F04DRAFT_1239546 [Mycena alexandri]